ncbi:MAG: SAM-dependent methyltransferase [Paraglaciecola sp.]|jgi:SAM-dependent methyltransferase
MALGYAGNKMYFATWAITTMFFSAFLLFEVQPIISKMILPWFGGSPMVWSTCLLFFQSLLLLGYTYTHVLVKQSIPVQIAIHLTLIVVAITLLPITPDSTWKPDSAVEPTIHILQLLTAHVGLPYILLSSTAPLVQSWYSEVYLGHSPYRLYAVSNVSSMLALLSYPFIIEPVFDSVTQGQYWSYVFCFFAAFIAVLSFQRWRLYCLSPKISTKEQSASGSYVKRDGLAPDWKSVSVWFFLPALASMLLMAITNHVSQDIAAIPFLWIVPLCLYLLSFILCFDSSRWYHRGIMGSLAGISILAISILRLGEIPLLRILGLHINLPAFGYNIVLDAGLYFSALFFLCMLCHGEMVKLKPNPRFLTLFYLMLSAGGAFGGIFVALICPVIFSTFVEVRLGLISGYVLVLVLLLRLISKRYISSKKWFYMPALVIMFGSLVVVFRGQFIDDSNNLLTSSRNFYGGLSVYEFDQDKPKKHRRVLYHGRISHGAQFIHPGMELIPNMYYKRSSGIGVALEYYPENGPLHVGVIGLGTGTMAAHGHSGDTYRFYEINPQVVKLANTYFTYLDQSPASTEVILGDARLSLEKESPQAFDLLVMDAFTGDAPPVHLLTKEAFAVYNRHLKPGGILALNVSNRHLDLSPLVAAIVQSTDMTAIEIDKPVSKWMLVTDNHPFIQNKAVIEAARGSRKQFAETRAWTDQYSNLLELLYF